MITRKGINASPGVAIGPALVLDTEEYRIPRRTVEPARIPRQIERLDNALAAARQEVAQLRVATSRKLGAQTSAIFAFHESFIADQRLRDAVVQRIEQNRLTAAYAFGQEMNQRQRMFNELNEPYLKERVRDLYDIEKRVLRHILGREREDITRLTEPVVIVAHDITPSKIIELDRSKILGFAIDVGGSTSHVAILTRQLGVPAVVALESVTTDVAGGETIIVDGTRGVVVVNPDERTITQFQVRQREHRALEKQLAELRDLPAITTDGCRIELLANIELAEEARHAMDFAAEGIGLYRTEFLFLGKARMPTEEEQYEVFRGAVRHARGKPITIRTMDLGADKMTSYFGVPHDHNPDLGLRSLRYCLQHLDMFKIHLRAILRAAAHGDVRIMFPMITTLMELRQAKATLADVMEDLHEDGVEFGADVQVGIMIETPAAAMMADAFARETDFFSIGTNDLTQYTLAADRGNERVAHLYAPHNPAVLRLVHNVVRAAGRRGKPVTVCGEMAGSPVYTQLLLGLGLRSLSMAPKDIPAVKKTIRSTSLRRCVTIARQAKRFDVDRQVINYLRDNLRALEEADA
ncbi:MAG: phosphoenolpyruvate--protein phosphotransferase [Planctomycetota bacterium]|nr:MAG: phosphoenolpyruvate--protein phosphotransferase [Planctomycetota bacterium]